jgi:hypothetical protein
MEIAYLAIVLINQIALAQLPMEAKLLQTIPTQRLLVVATTLRLATVMAGPVLAEQVGQVRGQELALEVQVALALVVVLRAVAIQALHLAMELKVRAMVTARKKGREEMAPVVMVA